MSPFISKISTFLTQVKGRKVPFHVELESVESKLVSPDEIEETCIYKFIFEDECFLPENIFNLSIMVERGAKKVILRVKDVQKIAVKIQPRKLLNKHKSSILKKLKKIELENCFKLA